MACQYYFENQLFKTKSALTKYIAGKSSILSNEGWIEELYTIGTRNKSLIKKDFGTAGSYVKAREIFSDLMDQAMNPIEDITEDLDNIPFSRAEAISLTYSSIQSLYQELKDSLANAAVMDEQEEIRYKALSALQDIEVYNRLVEDFYPNFKFYKAKTGEYVYTEGNPSVKYNVELVDTDNLEDVAGDPETDIDKLVDQMMGGITSNYNDDEDTINPLRKASQAVKDFMSSILTSTNGEKQFIEPGYVFYKMLQNVSNITTGNVKDELTQLDKNFKSNGMKSTSLSDRDYQIFLKLKNLYNKSSVTTKKDGTPLPTEWSLRWDGDNQKGWYTLHTADDIISLRGMDTQDAYLAIQEKTGETMDTVNRMYQQQQASDVLNSIFFVVNSMREKNPIYAEYKWKFTKDKRQTLIRKYKPFKNNTNTRGVRNFVENSLLNNYEKLISYKGRIAQLKKTPTIQGVSSLMNDLNLIPSVNIYLKSNDLPLILSDLEGMIEPFSQVGKVFGKDEEGTDIFITPESVIDDNKTRIKNLTAVAVRDVQERGRSTSYKGGDGKQRWFHTLSNQALNTVDKIVNNSFVPAFLKTQFFKYNFFLSSEKKLNTIHGLYDHDAIADEDASPFSPKPVTYRKEDALSWYERNFLYGFINFISNNTAKGTQYIQQFYTISNKPNMQGARIDVLSPIKIKEGIKQALLQEINRPENPGLSTYNKNSPSLGEYTMEEAKENIDATVEKIFKQWEEKSKTNFKSFLALSPRMDASLPSALIKLGREGYIPEQNVDLSEFNLMYRKGGIQSQEQQDLANKYLYPLYDLYYKNFFINSYFLNQITAGDPAQYKNAEDEIKRMGTAFALGNKGRINDKTGLRTTFNVMVLADQKESITEGSFGRFKRLLGKDYEYTDGQGFAIPERMNNIRKGFSREANIGSTAKPVYFGIQPDGISRAIKYSTIELTDELAKAFPDIRELRYHMTFGRDASNTSRTRFLYDKMLDSTLSVAEKIEYDGNIQRVIDNGSIIDESVFKSAFKVGVPSSNSVYDPQTGRVEINQGSVITLENQYYAHQLNPRSDPDTTTSNMTQLTYQLNTNGRNFESLAKVLKLNALIQMSGLRSIMKELSGDKYDNTTRRKVREKMITLLQNVPGNERIVEFLQTEDISLNLPFIVNKLQQSLLSMFSKNTVSIKHKGSKLVLQSAIGTNSIGRELTKKGFRQPELVMLDAKGKKTTDSKSASSYYMEAYVPENIYKQLLNEGVSPEAILQNPVYANILGFRIPSTELHSAVPLKIIGWYPTKYGDNIIVTAKELVLLHGSDFDIDTLYTVSPFVASKTQISPDGLYIANKGVAIGYEHHEGEMKPLAFLKGKPFTTWLQEEHDRYKDNTTQEKYLEVLDELMSQAASNEILNEFLSTITAEKNIDDMMTPIDLGAFNDINNPESVFYKLWELKVNKLPDGEREKYLKAEPEQESKKATWRMELLKGRKNLNDLNDQIAFHQDNFRASSLVGTFANSFKIISYLFMSTNDFARNSLTEDEQPLPILKENYHMEIDGVKYDSFNRYVKTADGLLDGKNGRERSTIWQNLDSMINAAIDHVKEQILNIVNASPQTANAFTSMIAMGIPLGQISLFMTQPVMIEVSNRSREGRNIINNLKGDLKTKLLASTIAIDPGWKSIVENGTPEEIEKAKANLFEQAYEGVTVTSKKLRNGWGKNYDNINEFSPDDIIFQYKILDQFSKLDEMGRNYLFKGAMALSSVQKLPNTFTKLQNLLQNYDEFFDINKFLDENIGESREDLPFTNVNLQNVPNVASSVKVVDEVMKFLGGVFIKDNPNFIKFSNLINSRMLDQGIVEEENRKEASRKGFADWNVNQSLSRIRELFVEYILSGVKVSDPISKREYSFSTMEEIPSEGTRIVREGGERVNRTVEYSGTAAWVNRFINLGSNVEINGKIYRLKSLKEIKNKFGDRGNNKFLAKLEIKTDRKTALPYLIMGTGNSLDASEKVVYEQYFDALRNLPIYEDENGNDILPEDTSQFNDLQYALLKYEVLQNGLSFGSNNYSAFINTSLYKGVTKFIDQNLFSMFVGQKKNGYIPSVAPTDFQDNFVIQLAVQEVDKLQSIFNIVVKEGDNFISGKEEVDGNVVYFDAKVLENSEKMPYFARLGKSAYLQVAGDEQATYYQKIERLDSNKNFQFSPSSKGYKIADKFKADRLALGYTTMYEDEGGKYILLQPQFDTRVNSVLIGGRVSLYEKSDYARHNLVDYEVTSREPIVKNEKAYIKVNVVPLTEEQKEEEDPCSGGVPF